MNNKETDHEEATPQEETPAPIQGWGILLLASSLKTVSRKLKGEIRLGYHSQGYKVDGRYGFSTLDVHVEKPSSGKGEENKTYVLTFTLKGVFVAEQDIPADDYVNMMRHYSIPIMLPYAREYASDQFRRAGLSDLILPIINLVAISQLLDNGEEFLIDLNYEE
jgi:preprotein translocase subunit SecB